MQELGPAKPAPSKQEIIDLCGKSILRVMEGELSDANDPDRIWLLRIAHRNYTYYRDLINFVANSITGIVDVTGVAGPIAQTGDDSYGFDSGDYSQNIYRGFCRKLEGVLGNRLPTVIAVPNDPDDEEAIKATKSANAAAAYIIQKCDMRVKMLELVFSMFNFGTIFWQIEWVVDGEKYGYEMVPDPTAPETIEVPLGDGQFLCPQCATSTPGTPEAPPPACAACGALLNLGNYHPPTPVTIPNPNIPKIQKPKGALEISLRNCTDVYVPLESTGVDDPNCGWLRFEQDIHKSVALADPEYGEKLRSFEKDASFNDSKESTSSVYAQQIRSSFSSPIGLIRPLRTNQWTKVRTWWKPSMYNMVTDKQHRQLLREQFPKGLVYTSVRGQIVDITSAELAKDWREVKPEPSCRIMGDPLGNDFVQPQEIVNSTLNQQQETIERSNQPMFADATRIDTDAFQANRAAPGRIFPAIKPAGGSLRDIIFQPEPVVFSEQIPVHTGMVEDRAKNIAGLPDTIWGGGDSAEPTARQAELKRNAAMQQLATQWMMIGRSLEFVNRQSCEKLAEYEDGTIEFSKKNQFGKFDKQTVVAQELKSQKFHFEADEAVPTTWGQQRDILMWFMDKPAELADRYGVNDILNIPKNKSLIGIPGEHVPMMDDRDKGMAIIQQLLEQAPLPGDPDQETGQPGPVKPSIEPAWEDNHAAMADLVKKYLVVNHTLAQDKPDGYANVVAWGKAQEEMANAPAPPEPTRTSVNLSVKPQDIGPDATQKALEDAGIIPPGTPVEVLPPPPKPGTMLPPGAPGLGEMPTGPPQ
jgi:hypothetical protein